VQSHDRHAQGRLDSEDVLCDNGTRTFINLDQAGTQSFTKDWFTYDAQGRLDTQDVINDDGSHTFYNYDQAGTGIFWVVASIVRRRSHWITDVSRSGIFQIRSSQRPSFCAHLFGSTMRRTLARVDAPRFKLETQQ
jgi:hypothetical protein